MKDVVDIENNLCEVVVSRKIMLNYEYNDEVNLLEEWLCFMYLDWLKVMI